MNTKRFIVALLLVFAVSGVAYPWGSSGGDGSRAAALRETSVFFNNSGGTLPAGSLVIIDTRSSATGSGSTLQQAVVAGTTMGSFITTTATEDASGVVGVVLGGTTGNDYCGNQEPCIVVTKGAADTLVLDSTDIIITGSMVSTGTTAGFGGSFDGTCNGGVNTTSCIVGLALEGGDATDTGKVFIYVNP